MLILSVILSIFVYGMIASTLGTILPDLSERFTLSPRQNGIIAFAQALGLILASLAVGPLLDWKGKSIGLFIGLGLIAVVLVTLPRCPGYKSIVMLMFLMGAGGGVLITAANAVASDISGARRGSVLNLVNLFFGLGGFVTPFIAANLFAKRLRRLCDAIAVFSLFTFGIVLMSPIPKANGIHRMSFNGAEYLLTQPTLLLLSLFLFLYVSCEVGVWNWLPQHLIAQGIPEPHALNILSFGFALGLLAGRVLISPVLLRVPAVTVLVVASAAMTVTTLIMLLMRRATSALVAVALAGLAMAPVYPTTLAIVGGKFSSMTGTALGIVITCGWIGLAASSRFIGALAGADTRRLRKALMIIPIFCVCMLLLSLFLQISLQRV